MLQQRLNAIFTITVRKRQLFFIPFLLYLFLSSFPLLLQAQEKHPPGHYHSQIDTGYNYYRSDTAPRLIPLAANVAPPPVANARTAATSANSSPVARVIAGPQVPNTFDPDRNKAVGEIPMQSGISPSGAVTYSVPIQVPQGKNGIQPDLSFQYSSQAGTGPYGMGWSIGGFSTITAANATVYYDGNVRSRKIHKDDCFTLDGMRLIKLSENSAQIDYETEQGNIKVTAIFGTQAWDGQPYIRIFKVYYPNGTTGTFGKDNNPGPTLHYPISKYEDTYGNVVNFNSSSGYDEPTFRTITYDNCRIEFHYDSRTDKTETYTIGKETTMYERLVRIICKENNTVLRTYELEYEYGSKISLLNKIKCTAGGSELNPLIFLYGDGNTGADLNKQSTQLFSWFSNTTVSNLKIARGKFDYGTNNDGLIVFPNLNQYLERYIPGGTFSHSQKWYQNNFHPDQSLLVYQGLQDNWASPTITLTAGNGFINLLPADIDGKPGEEIIKINNYESGGWDQVNFTIYKPNLFSGIGYSHSVTINFSPILDWYGTKSIHPKHYYPGDFNGDGKMEMLVISVNHPLGKEEITSTTYIVDMNNGAIMYQGSGLLNFTLDFATGSNNDRIIIWDYDGDGKDDIGHGTTGLDYYTFDVSGSSFTLRKTGNHPYLGKSFLNNRTWYMAEVNGDGLPDIVTPPDVSYYTPYSVELPIFARRFCETCGAEGTWNDHICLNCHNYMYESYNCYECNEPIYEDFSYETGEYTWLCPNHGAFVTITRYNYTDGGKTWFAYLGSGEASTKPLWMDIKNYEMGEHFLFQDMNNDGLSDLVGEYNGTLNVYLNNATTFDGTSSATNYVTSGSYLIPANISGYIYTSHLLNLHNDQVHKLTFTRNDAHQRLVTGAINSQGVITKNAYACLNEDVYQYGYGNNHYTPGYGALFPYENYQGPLTVVTNAQTWLNNVKQSDLSFTYNNAIVHRQGRGFLGFESIQTYDEKKELTSTRTANPFQYGAITKEESPTSLTTFEYSVTTEANKIAKVWQTKKTATDLLKNTTVTSTYVHDVYGNPTTEVVDFGGGLKTTTTTGYYNDITATKVVIGVPLSQTITNERNGSSHLTGIATTYNPQLDPLTRNSTVNGNTVKQETWAYDAYGNVTEEKTKAYNAPVWTIHTHEYDGSGRFRTKTTNPLSQVTTWVYNPDGTVQSQTDFKGNITTYVYDSWQRPISISNPDGTTQTNTYDWQPAGTDRLYSVKTEITGKPASKVHYDAMNRKVRKTLTGFDGAEVHTDQTYDDFGRELTTSQPFKNSATGLTTKDYDQYNRLTQINQANGGIITYGYNGNSIIETKNGVSEIKTFDGQGKLLSITNPSGSVTYTLRPDGQPASITAPGGTTSFSYDSYGRQSQLQDPSAGNIQYGYDDAGNVNSQTDGNNKTIQSTYDNYNRITSKTTPEFSTTYAYDADGRLKSVTGNNGTVKTMWYDDLGRITQLKEETGTEYYQINYAYQNGRLQQATHLPMNYTVNYQYNTNGYLYQLTDGGGQTINTINKINVWGKTEESLLGNGLSEAQTFDANGFLTGMKTAYGQTTLRNLETSYDNTKGNLLFRKDVVLGLTENFQYDQLERLTNYGPAAQAQQITYDNGTGNITGKSDAGSYNYNISGNPYAVSSVVQGNSVVLPAYQQHVSYSSFARPLTITYGPDANSGYAATLTYNDAYDRAKMEMKYNGVTTYNRYYFSGGQYEKTIRADGSIQSLLYLDGSPYDATVALENNNGTTRLLYISRDNIGSITHITDANRNLLAENSYDAWGRLRNPATWAVYTPGAEPEIMLRRGFTGHEYLRELGLINMNARLYDPLLGRMLSPDNYVQEINNPQSFNRYSYALNNPLKYKDPSGNLFLIDDFLIGFVKGAVLSAFGTHEGNHRTVLGDAWASATRHTVNSIRIYGGLFTTNPQHGFWSRSWELVSRFTWQMPQELFGFYSAHAMNMFGTVRSVNYFDGATVLQGGSDALWWGGGGPGMTLGNYIMGSVDIAARPDNVLLAHEYGHYLQSQKTGPLFIWKFGLPSLFSGGDHDQHPVEQDASARGFMYFQEHYPGALSIRDYLAFAPINGYNQGRPFNDPANQNAMRGRLIRNSVLDYLLIGGAEAIYYSIFFNN